MTNLSYLLGAAIAVAILGAGVLIAGAAGPTTATSVVIVIGFFGLLAVGFHYALRELGAFDRPPEPPSVLESGPDILSVDLRDRDDR